MSKTIKIVLISCLVIGYWSSYAQYYPNTEWERKSPSTFKINESKIQEAVAFAKANEYQGEKDIRLAILKGFSREPNHELLGPTKKRGGPAGMIIKNGYVIAEWGDLSRVDMTFSVTKSYLSTTVGLAFDNGLISEVNDRVDQYIWDGTFAGKHNSQITWEHLLHQTSDWSGALFGLYDWADRPTRDGQLDDWRYRELHTPGTHFKYNDVRVNVLSYSLLNVWRRPLPMVLKERIMDPIGASTTWRWFGYENSKVVIDGIEMSSVSGGGHHGGGMFINTYDQARFGLLFCRDGKWNNNQLISREWVKIIQTPAPAMESYGYMWWLNRGEQQWSETPDHLFYAAGFGGNYIVVDQEQDLVIVTRWLEPSQIGELVKTIYSSF
ncbi:serine hydrolase domain-containing protein [Marinoscillum sp.]|uniref:serine hydrolase domain-containing protein n=1 Tax=Marinoscillum sp. TaxID=2024838 RepID=UPI003BAC9E0F